MYVYLALLFSAALIHAEGSEWLAAEKRAQNAVVQVYTQRTEFNWLDPYRSPEQSQSTGSGFFIDNKGHILTNYHVVAGAKSVHILLPVVGRKPLDVTIIGVCPDFDVALIKLTKESYDTIKDEIGDLNTLEFGDSDELYNTQPVLALGFPLGMRTIKSTVGVVAGRDFIGGTPLIHITAPINPGNSGGPLLSLEGKVLGINAAGWQNSQNYNYIVPINNVLIVLDDLYKKNFVRRPTAGLSANRGTEAHARSLGNPLPTGIYVHYVYENSMEARAGIAVGDMIYEVRLNGERFEVDEFGEVAVPWRQGQKISLEELLVRCHRADHLTFVLYRAGQRLELSSTFEEPILPPIRLIYPEYEPEEIDYEIIGGAVFMQLRENHFRLLSPTHQLKEYSHPENQSKAVLVITRILPGSQAHRSDCLFPGMLLDTVNGKTVTTLPELREALMLSLKTGEIAIQTKDRFATVLDLQKVLADEERLARDFMFPLGETVKELQSVRK